MTQRQVTQGNPLLFRKIILRYFDFCFFVSVFEQYQKARHQFVQTIADYACRPHTIDFLHQAGVMNLLKPLLMDCVPSIQQTAAIALGRIANHSDAMAEAVVEFGVLPQLVYSLADQNVSTLVKR